MTCKREKNSLRRSTSFLSLKGKSNALVKRRKGVFKCYLAHGCAVLSLRDWKTTNCSSVHVPIHEYLNEVDFSSFHERLVQLPSQKIVTIIHYFKRLEKLLFLNFIWIQNRKRIRLLCLI